MVLTYIKFYIPLLNTTLSEKIALPAIKATAKIIGRLMVAPAMSVDIPINIDRPKDSNLVIQFSSTLDKNHSNWDYSSTFNMSMIENDNTRHELMAQEISGTVLTDDGGRIVRSEEASDLLIKQKHQSSKAVTTFLADDAGRLSKAKRVSTLGNDSGNTVYSYGAKNRLIRTKSGTTTADFTYDNDDRELASKEVMKSFTTETTITTCKSWDKFGRCINAQQNISILIKDVKKNRDNVYDHVAEIKYDYVY